MNSEKKRIYSYSILSGVLLSASILSPFLSFISWFALVPFLIVLQQASPSRSFIAGLLVSVLFFTTLLYWILYYELRIFIVSIILVVPFFGIFAFFVKEYIPIGMLHDFRASCQVRVNNANPVGFARPPGRKTFGIETEKAG